MENEKQEQPQLLVIDAELASAILQYLAAHPYAEVAGLIQRLQAIKPVKIKMEQPE